MNKNISLITPFALALPTHAFSQQVFNDRFSADFVVELQTDFNFDATDPDAEFNDTFATIEGALSYAVTDAFSLNATLLIEPVRDAEDDRFLEDHGLYAEALFFEYDFGAAQVIFGKFNPAFGSAWDIGPGIYGVDFAEEYEITEQIGAAVTVPFELGGGAHEASFALFNVDRSALSSSLGARRGQTSLGDGGPGNTSGAESFTLAVSGSFGATGYNVEYQQLESGQGDTDDQSGFVIGVTHSLQGSLPLELLGEVAFFDDFGGADAGATIGTFGVSLPVGPVGLSAFYAFIDADNAPTSTLATFSAEYALFDGFSAALGYRYGDEDNLETHTIGTLFVYEF